MVYNSAQVNKILYSKHEAMALLGIGEKMFRSLDVPYVTIGRRKKYALSDLQLFIARNREDPACLGLAKGKARRTTGTTSRSAVIGFEEAVKLIASKQRKPSPQSCAQRP